MPGPDILTVAADPKFQALPELDQHAILGQLDPNFAALPDEDKPHVIDTLQRRALTRPDLVSPPAVPQPKVNMHTNPLGKGYEGPGAHDIPGSFEGHPENIGEWPVAGPGEIAGGVKDIATGKIARGGHRVLSGAGNTLMPFAPFVAVAAPAATARAISGGYIGGRAAEGGADLLNLSPDQKALAGDVGNLVGGGIAAEPAPFVRGTGRLLTARPRVALRALGEKMRNFGMEPPPEAPNPFRDVPEPGPPDVFNVSEPAHVAAPPETPAPYRIKGGPRDVIRPRGLLTTGAVAMPEGEILPPAPISRPYRLTNLEPEDVGAPNPRVLARGGGIRTTPIAALPAHAGENAELAIGERPTQYAPIYNAPHTLSGEGALRQILTGQDNKALLQIARARGIDVAKEAQLKPGIADSKLINKIIDDFSPDELDNIRSEYMENTRHRARLGNIGPEAQKTLSLQSYFPDLKIPKARLARTQAAIQQARTQAAPQMAVPGEPPDLVPLRESLSPARRQRASSAPKMAALGEKASDDLTGVLQSSLEQARAKRGRIPAGASNEGQPPAIGRQAESRQVPEPLQPNTPPANGAETTIRVPGEPRSYAARYQIRELEDVQPSHSGITFNPNPKYSLVNDRDYSNMANRGKVISASAPGTFDPSYHLTDNPDATNGPIVIDSSGHALGGNGRAMILDRVYRYNPEGAANYKTLLASKAPQFGLNPEDIARMKRPVLVREIADREFAEPEAKQAAITDFNKKGTAEMTPSERAIVDSRRVSQGTLDEIAAQMDDKGPDATLADVLRSPKATEIVDRLISEGVISPQERAAYAGLHGLTDAGKDRISKLLVGRFFRDPAQLDSTPLSIRGKLERLAAPLAKLDGRGEWDLAPKMQEAIDLLEEVRGHEGSTVDDLLKQQGLFGTSRYSPEAVALAKRLQASPVSRLLQSVRRYIQDAADAQRPLLMGHTISQKDAFRENLGR